MQRQRRLAILGGTAAVLGLAAVVAFAQVSLTRTANGTAPVAAAPAPAATQPRRPSGCRSSRRSAAHGLAAGTRLAPPCAAVHRGGADAGASPARTLQVRDLARAGTAQHGGAVDGTRPAHG